MKVDKTQFDSLLRRMIHAEPVKRTEIKTAEKKPGAILTKPKQ
jgi:hypothetical protein